MSLCSILDLRYFPVHRVPKRLGGKASDTDCIFSLDRAIVIASPDLQLHFDAHDANMLITHGVIEPAHPMLPHEFAKKLAGTVNDWNCLNL